MTAMFTKIRLKLRLGNKEKINIKSQQNCFKTVLNGLILTEESLQKARKNLNRQ